MLAEAMWVEAAMTAVGLEPCPVCGQGIIKCAHLGDKVVWLGDHRTASAHGFEPDTVRWGVTGPGTVRPCLCPDKHPHLAMEHDGRLYYRADSLADAEGEFERRERLLLEE